MSALDSTLDIVFATHPGTDEHACPFCIGRGVTCGAARVLAGVRAVLDLHKPDKEGDCSHCFLDRPAWDGPAYVEWPCETVRLLTGQPID